MRKLSKDCRVDKTSINSRLQAEGDSAIKAPPVMSHSAQEPAYLFTSACSDPKRRKPPVSKKVQDEAFR